MIDTEYEMSPSLSGALSAAQDRRQFKTYESVLYQDSPSFEIRTNVLDPSGGALYSGGSSYSPDIPFMASSSGLASFQAPLCQRDMLGSLNNFKANLAGFDDVMNKDVKTENFKFVESAASVHGTIAADMARKLASQASDWMQIAKDRLFVVKNAREAYDRLKNQVDDLDKKTAVLIAAKKLNEAEKIRKEAVNKAKLALQYQKVNALSTELSDMALAQSVALQDMADATINGKYFLIKDLATLYTNYVNNTKKIRDLRKKQLANLRGSGLQGVPKQFIDYFEEDLNGLSLKKKQIKPKFIYNGYTVEQINPGIIKNNTIMSVGSVLSGASIKTKTAVKQVIKKPVLVKKPIVSAKHKSVQVKRPTSINMSQIARQGNGAATAALVAGNIKGITPQQLTDLTRQAQILVNGSAGSASDILAQARKL